MATRSRRPASSSRQSSPTPPEAETSQQAPAQTANEDAPEVRLLGSLYPLPSREERIAIAAYWRAAKRQFAPGHELDDWLEAEREIESDGGKEQRSAVER